MIQQYQGRQRYSGEVHAGPHRLLVAVTCFIADYPAMVSALLDTAAEWNVLSAQLTHKLGFAEELDYPTALTPASAASMAAWSDYQCGFWQPKGRT